MQPIFSQFVQYSWGNHLLVIAQSFRRRSAIGLSLLGHCVLKEAV
jgi:hypothetical protein